MTAIEVWGTAAPQVRRADGTAASALLICEICNAHRCVDDVKAMAYGGTVRLFCRHCGHEAWREAAA